MFKKINMFALALLIIGQTILGPIGIASANEFVEPVSQSVEEDNTNIGEVETSTTDEPDNGDIVGGTTTVGGAEADDGEKDSEEPLGNQEITTPDKGEPEDEEVDELDRQPQSTPSGDEDGEGNEEDDEITLFSTFPDVDRADSNLQETLTLKINGQVVQRGGTAEAPVGAEVSFRADLDLKPGHDYGEGSKLVYELPSQFVGLSDDKSIYYNGDLIGQFVVSGQIGTLTFTDAIRDESGAGTIVEDVFIEIKGKLQASGNAWQENIPVPGFETITLNFTPEATSANNDSKEGVADRNGKNSEYITWTVEVNKNLTVNETTGTTTFTDTLTGPHEFHSVDSITKLKMGPTGNVVSETPYTPLPSVSGTSMSIDLPNEAHTAYRIVYTTKVGDPGNVEDKDFKNTAKFGSSPTVSNSVNVSFGTPLEKTGSGPNEDLTTDWTIKYNHNKREIPAAQAILTDEWSTGHILDGGIKVYDENGDEVSSGFTPVLNGTNGFTLTFTSDVTSAYTIKYKTKPSGIYPTNGLTITNTVTRADITDYTGMKNSDTKTYPKKSFVLDKRATNVDYQSKKMSWSIEANQAKYTLDTGTTFTDTYNEPLLTVDDIPSVTVGGQPFTNFDFERTTNQEGKETGFIITLKEQVSDKVVITYTTSYDITDTGTNERDYTNTVVLGDTGIVDFGTSTDSATQTIKEEQKANGKKTGEYNYETKTFHWNVELNFNYNTINNAVFKDILPESQKVTSMTITKGSLNAGGNFVPSTDPDAVTNVDVTNIGNVIEYQLGDITGPYKVTYTSVDSDAVYPHGTAITISNTAKLYGDGTSEAEPNAKWEKDVLVAHTKDLIIKDGKQAGSSPQIDWNFQFNYAQSELNDIVITDTVGKIDGDPGQLILKDSFKVWEMNFTGTNSTPSKGNPVTLTEENFSVDLTNGSFELKLPNGDKAYYVEYSTVFMGASGSALENTVNVSYTSADGSSGSDQFSESSFTYDGGGKVGTVPFVIVKTDAATGLPMDDVKFDLYGPYTGNTLLMSGSTKNGGVLDYGVKLAPSADNSKVYRVVEEKQTGYKDLTHSFVLDRDFIETSGKYAGKQVIYIENEPEQGLTCDFFELTVYDIDGNKINNKEITLTNKATGVSENVTVVDGEVEFKRNASITGSNPVLKAGEYDVVFEGATLDTITVQYSDNCDANVQPAPKCDTFTIVVKDGDDIRTDIDKITLRQGSTEVEVTPTADGKFIVDSNKNDSTNGVKPGTYSVYEGKQYLGEVKLTYKETCGHEFVIIQAKTCPTFTLTVKDVDGELVVDGTSVTVKDSDDKEVVTKTTTDGKITLGDGTTSGGLEPGEYTVEIGGEKIGEFKTDIDCQAEVQPKPQCKFFTITIKDETNNVGPNTEITLKKAGQADVKSTTDENGKIQIPSENLPAGEYNVYEGGIFLGKVEVKYTGNTDCEATITTTGLNVGMCKTFTLTVKDRGNNPRESVKIIIKDADGKIVENSDGSQELTTDENGQVEYGDYVVKPGTYTAYEIDDNGNEKRINSFTVDTTCEATVKPPTGGGGGWIPPTDPENPDPEEPGEPTDPENPDPEEPGEPTDPENPNPEKPDPNNPGDNGSNTPGGGKPGGGSGSNTPGGDKPGDNSSSNKPGGDKPGTNGNVSTPGGKLPQTGEEQFLYMIALGALLIVGGGAMFMAQRRKEN